MQPLQILDLIICAIFIIFTFIIAAIPPNVNTKEYEVLGHAWIISGGILTIITYYLIFTGNFLNMGMG